MTKRKSLSLYPEPSGEVVTEFFDKGCKYRVSFEEYLQVGDFYIDFTLWNLHSPMKAIQKCDSQSLADHINNNYKRTPEYVKRLSAKIVATNDPVLNHQGVPSL
jgi:hypothetical protein